MKIEECKKYSKKLYRGKTKNIVDKQIDLFFEIEEKVKVKKHKYKIGDKVILNKNNYLHGIGNNVDNINFIAEKGILSKESTGLFGNHAFRFVVGLWKVKGKISLEEYIENYSGIVAHVNNKNWQVPYKKLDEFVETLRNVDHWKWSAESSMEIRFMPSLARNINQVGFIFNLESENAQKLLKNDINSNDFDKSISDNFLRKDLRKKFFNDKTNDFLERASYVIFGINKCFIEGIIVGRNIEKDKDKINDLKLLFPESYICNLDGKIIQI